MYVTAVIATALAMGLAIWLLATDGHPLQSASGFNAVKENSKWWHLPIVLIFLALVPWGVSSCMANAGRANVVGGYKQFLNGSLVSANSQAVMCHRDGACVHDYDCDSYVVKVVDQAAYSDDNGYHAEVSHYETRYHHCPEATKEYIYTVTGTFGFKNIDYVIADHIFALHPTAWRSSEGEEIEGDVPRGVPEEWRRYKWDLNHGNADPITAVDNYKNFLLASKDTILKTYSDDVDAYLKRGLLPEHTAGFLKGDPIKKRLNAYKMSFVGLKPANADLWQLRLMRFNAALGMKLQGDMHMVAIADHLVGAGQSETYANALKAYWQGPKMGKKSLAKNGIIVVIGVDSAGEISWARANTGMPSGNGGMITAIENTLPGKKFNPDLILGKVRAIPTQDKGKPSVKFALGYGLLTRIVFHDYPFARACMECKNKTDNGSSLVYLEAEIEVPFWAKFLNVLFSLILGAIGAGLVYATSPMADVYRTSSRDRY